MYGIYSYCAGVGPKYCDEVLSVAVDSFVECGDCPVDCGWATCETANYCDFASSLSYPKVVSYVGEVSYCGDCSMWTYVGTVCCGDCGKCT